MMTITVRFCPTRCNFGESLINARLSSIGLMFLALAALGSLGCSYPIQVGVPGDDDAAAGGPKTGASGSSTQVVRYQEAQPTETGQDWSAFLGPNGDGRSDEEGVEVALWNPHPPINWIMELGTSYGGPAIADGKLLQFDRFGNAERLTCFDAATARQIWQQETVVEYADMYGYNNGPRCAPIINDGSVYTYGVTGILNCVRLSDGELLWSVDTVQKYGVVQNFFGVASSPIVFGDKLYVMVGGSPAESQNVPTGRLDLVKPNGSAVVAFDKKTGVELYRVGDDLASYASLAIRTIEDEPTGLAFLRKGLIAWDLSSGEEKFQFPWRAPMLESVNAASPVTVGDQILLSEAYEVGSVLLSIEDGSPQVVWQDKGSRNRLNFRAHWSTPVVVGDYLYGCNGRNQPDSDFRCIRISDGEVQWRDRRHERSSVTFVDGYLVVLGEYGRLELVNPTPDKLDVLAEADLSDIRIPPNKSLEGTSSSEPGSTLSGPLLSYPCWAAPVISHGLLYIRGKDHLICMQLIPPRT